MRNLRMDGFGNKGQVLPSRNTGPSPALLVAKTQPLVHKGTPLAIFMSIGG